MSMLDTKPDREPVELNRRSGELNLPELLRWTWRQLTSMRTALILLLLLALTAIPGSVIPQERSDSLDATRWQDAHPQLTPIYRTLGLFNVYSSPWFAAVYILLMVSLVGCILPRTTVYLRALRAQPPRAPRNLTRLPDHVSWTTDEDPEQVLTRAREVLKRGHRLRADAADGVESDGAISAERGYLREAGNLVFHLSVLVVLVGFALGSLFGYRGGVLLVVGDTFANTLSQYDDFAPGSLFRSAQMEPFDFTVDKFDVDWEPGGADGKGALMARGFNAHLDYHRSQGAADEKYDLRVNHPLSIGNTDIFLIGHGYAPVITIRDAEGNIAYSKPTVFLPQGPDFFSVGVAKAPDARPQQVALDGFLYPFYGSYNGDPVNLMGRADNPVLSMNVWTGDLGQDDGSSQSVYLLDKAKATEVKKADGRPARVDLNLGDTVALPDNLGTVSFDRVVPWNRLQISQTPGTRIALGGVIAALIGMCASLFIRPRRVWVRARRDGSGRTLVEVAALDRSGGGDVTDVLSKLTAQLQSPARSDPAPTVPTPTAPKTEEKL